MVFRRVISQLSGSFPGSAFFTSWLLLAIVLAGVSQPLAAASQAAAKKPVADRVVEGERVTYRLRRGDTLFELFRRSGIGSQERSRWLQEIAKNLPTRKIRANSRVVFRRDPKTKALLTVQIEKSPGMLSTWDRLDDLIVYRGSKKTAAQKKAASDSSGNGPLKTLSPVHLSHVVRKGETFAGIVKPHGVFGAESQSWFLSLRRHHPKKALRPGDTLHLYFQYPPLANRAGNLRALQVGIAPDRFLTWNREHDEIVFEGTREVLKKQARETVQQDFRNNDGRTHQSVASSSSPADGTATKKDSPERPMLRAPSTGEPLASVQLVEHRLRSGDTLFEVLRSMELSGSEAKRWSIAVNRKYRTKRLRVGRKLVLYLATEAASTAAAGKRRLEALQIEIGQQHFLTWEREARNIAYRGKQKGPVRVSTVSSAVQKWLRDADKLPRRRHSAAPASVNTSAAQSNVQPLHRVTIKVLKGDTFGGLLRPLGVSGKESQLWYRALREHRATRVLRPGQKLYLHFLYPPDPKRGDNLRMLQVESNGGKTLSWHREGNDVFYGIREFVEVARGRKPSLSQYSFARLRQRNTLWEKAPPWDKSDTSDRDVEIKAVSGEISGSLYQTALRVGLHPQAVSQIVDIFGWDINFQTDLREGDLFRVLYRREFHPADSKHDHVQVLAVELVNRGRKHMAIYFENAAGQGNYYDPEGRSLSRSFLRYPLEFSRITSTVSQRRYHPILRVRRPHTGVDLAAPRGTPVRAVGGGVVTYAGWKGAYGRLIEIDHGGGMKTRYAHLRRFSRGIQAGAAVSKGQIIASVGCSGRCTGPHLHFEMWRNDEYINPLRVRFSPEDEIEPALLVIFENAKKSFLTKLSPSPHS